VTSILIVEDDAVLCEVLKDGLEHEGYRVRVVADGRTALAAIAADPPDLVLLDVMLPVESGLEVCRRLRSAGDPTPVIMLTARGLEADRVRGLRLGADDYVDKPFGFSELLARIEAVLRRSPRAPRLGDRVIVGTLSIDLRSQRAWLDGDPLELRPREFRVLAYLASRRNEVVSREELLRSVWGYRRPPDTRTVDVHVARLRRKIEADPGSPRLLVTVARRGYRLSG
jgi:two-component system alkaline phosphatase synthesis response regulator PhoP